MKHKHYDVIVAWAEGKTVQVLDESEKWSDVIVEFPMFDKRGEYRIKPEEQKDFAVAARIEFKLGQAGDYLDFAKTGAHNVEFVFDGETHELKALRRIKL